MVDEADSQGINTATTLGALNTTSMMGKAMSEAQTAIALFSDLFGPLPYGRIAMTQQPFPQFGQAWPMLVYMPISAFLDGTFRHQLGMDGGRSESFYKFVAAHEVSHQWWGHLLGWQSYRDQWLSEGFAQFSTSLFAQMVYQNEAFLKFWKELRVELFEKNKEGTRPCDAGAIALGYRLNSGKTGAVTQQVMYGKGAFVVHMLRMLMWEPQSGDARVMAMMKDFVKTYTHQNVSTEDFKRIVEKHITPAMDLMGNRRMDWFFNEWVYGTKIPEYRLSSRLEDAPGGQTKVVGTIAQDKVDPTFVMRVPVYANLNGKVVRLLSAVIDGNRTSREFQILLPQKPARLMLCAYEDVLCVTNDR
jgi:aminopeptidase N